MRRRGPQTMSVYARGIALPAASCAVMINNRRRFVGLLCTGCGDEGREGGLFAIIGPGR